jgi:hypothetical protein
MGFALAVAQEGKLPNSNKAPRQQVQSEPAHKFLGFQGYSLVPGTVGVSQILCEGFGLLEQCCVHPFEKSQQHLAATLFFVLVETGSPCLIVTVRIFEARRGHGAVTGRGREAGEGEPAGHGEAKGGAGGFSGA